MASEQVGLKVNVEMDANGIALAPMSVASLVDTLIETLTAANDLRLRMKKKIKSFESDTEVHISRKDKKPLRRPRDSSSSSSSDDRHRKLHWRHRASRSRSKSRKSDTSGDSDSDDETVSITKLVVEIKSEYDHGRKRLGERFTIGDFRAHTILQSQIISIQQSMLLVYRDSSLYDGFSRFPLPYFFGRLSQSCTTAHTRTIEVFAALHKDLLSPLHPHPQPQPKPQPHPRPQPHPPSHAPDPEPPSIPGAFPIHILPIDPVPKPPDKETGKKRRTSVTFSHSHKTITDTAATTAPSCGSNAPLPVPKSHLFCPYAQSLQRPPSRPLSTDPHCPSCKLHFPIKPGRAWEIVLPSPGSSRYRRFLITNRFVVKCHRYGGGFACVLCRRWREWDTVTRDVGGLVDHVWREHGGEEVKRDVDVIAC